MDENAFAEHKIAVVFLRHFGYQYTNQLITHSTIHMEEDKLAYAENFAESYESMVPNGFRFDPKPVLEQIVETNKVLDVYQGGEAAKKMWNLEIEDVNQFISDLTEEMKQAGMDEIVEEANRQLDEWKKKNS